MFGERWLLLCGQHSLITFVEHLIPSFDWTKQKERQWQQEHGDRVRAELDAALQEAGSLEPEGGQEEDDDQEREQEEEEEEEEEEEDEDEEQEEEQEIDETHYNGNCFPLQCKCVIAKLILSKSRLALSIRSKIQAGF
jgi:hypothetical protein